MEIFAHHIFCLKFNIKIQNSKRNWIKCIFEEIQHSTTRNSVNWFLVLLQANVSMHFLIMLGKFIITTIKIRAYLHCICKWVPAQLLGLSNSIFINKKSTTWITLNATLGSSVATTSTTKGIAQSWHRYKLRDFFFNTPPPSRLWPWKGDITPRFILHFYLHLPISMFIKMSLEELFKHIHIYIRFKVLSSSLDAF